MYSIGDYIIYGTKGVCLINDIAHIDMPGAPKDRLYYILSVQSTGSTVYLPTDSQKAVVRPVMTEEEAKQLIDDIPQIETLWVSDDKKRESTYKEAMKTCDARVWVSIIKALYLRKMSRLAAGKKVTALDEKYLRASEHELYGELSLVLGIPKEEMQNYIKDRIDG